MNAVDQQCMFVMVWGTNHWFGKFLTGTGLALYIVNVHPWHISVS